MWMCKNVCVMCMRVQPKFFPYYQCYDWIKTCMGIKMGQNSKLQFAPSEPQIWHPVHSQGSNFVQYLWASNYVHCYPKWMKKFMFSPKLTFIYPRISKLSNVQCPQLYLCEIENCPVRTFDRFILPAIELAKLPMNESSRKGDWKIDRHTHFLIWHRIHLVVLYLLLFM